MKIVTTELLKSAKANPGEIKSLEYQIEILKDKKQFLPKQIEILRRELDMLPQQISALEKQLASLRGQK